MLSIKQDFLTYPFICSHISVYQDELQGVLDVLAALNAKFEAANATKLKLEFEATQWYICTIKMVFRVFE